MAISTDFINSEKINVFPCGGRDSKYDATSKLTTEYNLVSIINRLVDQGSFVVSNSIPKTGEGDFLFNIGGYLFSVSDLTFNSLINNDNKSEGSYIVAYIKPAKYINNEMTYIQLSPLNTTSDGSIPMTYGGILDDNSNFTGVEFVLIPQSSIPTNTNSLTVNKHTFEYKPRSIKKAADGSDTIVNDGIIRVTETQLPLLQYNGSSWVIPPDSKIKFRTTTNGSHRSISIDDGELSNIEVTSISFDKTSATLEVGDTLKLTATIQPSDASDKTIIWSSSNDSIATVSRIGEVTAMSAGKVIISASTYNSKIATCDITVNPYEKIVDGITYTLVQVQED